MQIRDQLSRVYDTVNQVEDVRLQVNGLRKRLPDNAGTKPVLQSASDLDHKLASVRDDLIQVKIKANEDSLAYPQKVDSKLAFLALAVGDGSDSAPTEAAYRIFDKLKKQSEASLARWSEIQKNDLAAFQKMVAGQNIQAIVVPVTESTGAGGAGPR